MLAQALSLAYAAGLSPYATVAMLGLLKYSGWVGALPAPIDRLTSPWIVGLACTLAVIEFLATLVPWVASSWDAVHTAIRPVAAAALAVATAWHADPLIITMAGLLGGTLGLSTHLTKLGLRVAVDSSPEPVTNGAMNVAELGVIASMMFFVWHNPVLTLVVALALLVVMLIAVRMIWRMIKRFLSGGWRHPASIESGAR